MLAYLFFMRRGMHLKSTLSKFIFAYLVFCIHSTLGIANAPSSLVGKKIQATFEDQGRVIYINSDSSGYTVEDGIWQPMETSYSKSNSTGYLTVRFPFSGKIELILNFNNQSTGTFSYDYSEDDLNGVSQVLASGEGTFIASNFNESEIPHDKFFSDNFDSDSFSTQHWNLTTKHGINRTIKDGKLLFSGTLTDPDERWFEPGANSILSLNDDWIVESSSFATLDKSYNFLAGIGTYIGFDEGTLADMSIGVGPGGYIFAECYIHAYENYPSQYKSTFREPVSEGSFRIFNSPNDKFVALQYWSQSNSQKTWKTIYEFNWETGILTEKNTYLGQDVDHQFSNWLSNGDGLVWPMLGVVTPNIDRGNDQVEIFPLEKGDLGFTSFSVTEGPPFDMPTSIDGKKLIVNYTLDDGSTGTNEFFFDSGGELWGHYDVGDSSAFWDQETFTWTSSQNSSIATSEIQNKSGRVVSGTLNFTDSSTGSLSLLFYESQKGQQVQNASATGTFSISDYSANELPASKGWMWFDSYPWVYSDIEKDWLYFHPSGSKLMIYSNKDQAWKEME